MGDCLIMAEEPQGNLGPTMDRRRTHGAVVLVRVPPGEYSKPGSFSYPAHPLDQTVDLSVEDRYKAE